MYKNKKFHHIFKRLGVLNIHNLMAECSNILIKPMELVTYDITIFMGIESLINNQI